MTTQSTSPYHDYINIYFVILLFQVSHDYKKYNGYEKFKFSLILRYESISQVKKPCD